jgi:hypothetical protein
MSNSPEIPEGSGVKECLTPDIVERLRRENAMPPLYGPPKLQLDAAAEITRLTAEVERLNAVNALMEYAAFPSADDANEAEAWVAANPGRPLSDYCPPGGLLVKRLTAEIERLRANAVNMLDEVDREYNRKTNAMIERHAATVARLTAEVELLRAALERLSNELRQFGYEESTLAALSQERT